MYQPQDYGTALTFMIVTMICWGSWANAQKMVPGFPFQLFYWDYVVGVLLATVAFGATLGSHGASGAGFLANLAGADRTAVLFALVGGAVFNVANLLLVAAIAVAGLAIAFPVGIGIALIVGVVLNYLLAPKGSPLLLFGGVALVSVAILVAAAAFGLRGGPSRADTRRGLVLSLVCGLLMGSFYPLVTRAQAAPAGLNSYTVAFVFALGVLLCALPVNSLLMRRPITGEQPTSFAAYRQATLPTHASGLLGGLIWGTGLVLSLVAAAAALVGPAVSYAIGQGATMVSALWGVFVWREFAGAPRAARALLVPMFLLFVVGLALIAVAPLHGG